METLLITGIYLVAYCMTLWVGQNEHNATITSRYRLGGKHFQDSVVADRSYVQYIHHFLAKRLFTTDTQTALQSIGILQAVS